MRWKREDVAKPPRIVNDTNVWLSALYFAGNEAKVVSLIEEKQAFSVTPNFIMDELEEKMVLKFQTPPFAANGTVAYIKSISELVSLEDEDFGLRDSDDNQVLETAVVGKCNFLITGDKDLLTVKQYQDLQIVTAAQFLVKYNK